TFYCIGTTLTLFLVQFNFIKTALVSSSTYRRNPNGRQSQLIFIGGSMQLQFRCIVSPVQNLILPILAIFIENHPFKDFFRSYWVPRDNHFLSFNFGVDLWGIGKLTVEPRTRRNQGLFFVRSI